MLSSAEKKGQIAYTCPDQNNIDGAAHEIGKSHERNATDHHYYLLALFAAGKIAYANGAEKGHSNIQLSVYFNRDSKKKQG